jgi:hypothetical protein
MPGSGQLEVTTIICERTAAGPDVSCMHVGWVAARMTDSALLTHLVFGPVLLLMPLAAVLHLQHAQNTWVTGGSMCSHWDRVCLTTADSHRLRS